jgi:hypothetical protein
MSERFGDTTLRVDLPVTVMVYFHDRADDIPPEPPAGEHWYGLACRNEAGNVARAWVHGECAWLSLHRLRNVGPADEERISLLVRSVAPFWYVVQHERVQRRQAPLFGRGA